MTEENFPQNEEMDGTASLQEEAAELSDVSDTGSDIPKWYVIHTYSGYENKVRDNLIKRIETQGMADKIFDVRVIEVEEVTYSSDGNSGKQKRRVNKRKVYPGYVFVEMIMSDRSWYVVRNTPGVTGFVSPGMKPVPLPEAEVEEIKRLMGMSAPQTIKLDVKVGEKVRIISGAFQDHTGSVVEIDAEGEKLKLLIEMFNRETELSVSFGQVEKV